jgi:hypothetical protein
MSFTETAPGSSMSQPPVVAVNEPSSTGHQIIQLLERMTGCRKILLLDDSRPLKIKHPEDWRRFDRVIHYDGERGHVPLIQQLKLEGVNRPVICGGETAIFSTDQLNGLLKFEGNDPTTSVWRRNKAALQDRLLERGLPSIQQCVVTTVDEALVFFQSLQPNNARDSRRPMILKPVNGTAGQGVYVCNTCKAVRAAWNKIVALGLNILGEPVAAIVCQRYVAGDSEWTANGVSCRGQLLLTHCWEYRKTVLPNGRIVYDQDILIPWSDRITQALVQSHRRVLEACMFRLGASHGELKLDRADGFWYTFEWAGRIEGGLDCDLVKATTGFDPLEYLVLAHVNAEEFFRRRETQAAQLTSGLLELHASARCVNLISDRNAEFVGLNPAAEESIRGLNTFRSLFLRVKSGAYLQRTVDLLTSPGAVFLLAKDEKPAERERALDRDASIIRNLEQRGLLYAVRQTD